MGGILRRSALKLIGGAPLAFSFDVGEAAAQSAAEKAGRAVKAAAGGQPYKPKFFTSREWETVRALSDLIIPRDERSGSATDAGVPEFIDFVMTDPLQDDRGREQRQVAMRGGLAWIDTECRRRFAKAFLECGEAERRALLDDIAYLKDGSGDGEPEPRDLQVVLSHGASFFHSFRDLVASGFWSSKMGVADIGYVGNKFVPMWSGPPKEVLRKLGLEE